MSYTKKYIYKKQYSIDEGQTWEDVVPLELTTSGDSIGYFDTLEECQTTPYGLKFYATFSNKSPLSVECNGNPELNSYDTGFAEENITSAIIGDCVIKIQGSLFGNTNLSSVTISDSVMYIGYAAFTGCKNLKRVNSSVDGVCNIPSGVTSIDYSAFQSCSSLSSVTIGSGVTYIGYGAFGDCSGLTSIDIPSGVTSIGDSAFRNCSGLTSITVNATTPPTLGGYNVFDNTNNCPILVPCESVDTYKTASKWSNLASRIQPINGSCTSYSGQYLTFVAEDNSGMFKFTNAVNYSLDSGSTWTSLAANNWTPLIASGASIMFKATLSPISDSYGVGTFSSGGRFSAEGNPMSLLYGDNFSGQTSLSGKRNAFKEMFNGCTLLTSAEHLSLPATSLSEGCYDSMFRGCTSLTTVPSLPATTLASYCYENMFFNCTSLTTALELPATTLANNCYYGMFRGCTSLTTVPTDMLPAIGLAASCYQNMFSGCTSLTTVPTDLLPAIGLTNYCYANMFYGCTSLTTAPELLAIGLAEYCYYNMFHGCSSLNYIKCLATDISANSCTNYWVYDVASSGTFVKASSMTSWTTGDNGIPNGWTVIDAS